MRLGWTLLLIVSAGLAFGQDGTQTPASTPAQTASATPHKPITLGELVDSATRQERRMTQLMRNFHPIVETYIQEQQPDQALGTSPKADDYFLSRLDVSGRSAKTLAFSDEDRSKKGDQRKAAAFVAGGFADALFPDLDHFDRQNYDFEFVRWETLGDLRCGVLNVAPHEKTENRGFIGRIWVEDQNFNIVRFTGAYTSKAFSKRSFHFDSWRLNTISIVWTPAYVYTEESDPHDSSRKGVWLKAQTRVWGYDLANAGDHKEYAKRLTDNPTGVDPNRHEASQGLDPSLTLGKSTYTADDDVVERLQVAGLMAPDGEVNRVLQTVVNNILVTNDLDIPAVRCRVLLTTPLESFVMGRTIVLSRGLVDVLPDEATLAAVLSHELAHIVFAAFDGREIHGGTDLAVFRSGNLRASEFSFR